MEKEEKIYLQRVLMGILIMSQIAGIIGVIGYGVPTKTDIIKLWSKE